MPRLASENLTLFELLREAGYRNTAVLRHYCFARKNNMHQGFHPRDWRNYPRLTVKQTQFDVPAPAITRRAIRWLKEFKKTGRKFSLLLHYADPHRWYMGHMRFPITAKGPERKIQKYDYEIAFVDRYVGRLLESLRRLGLHRNTAVIFFSDHGETFGHRNARGKLVRFHGRVLYDELIHVPLAFRIPRVSPRVVEDRVMLLDVGPTILEMIGRPVPKSFQGSSLLPYFHGKRLPSRTIRAESLAHRLWMYPAAAVMERRWKLHFYPTDGRVELYDLNDDPGELRNVARDHPDVVARLRKHISAY